MVDTSSSSPSSSSASSGPQARHTKQRGMDESITLLEDGGLVAAAPPTHPPPTTTDAEEKLKWRSKTCCVHPLLIIVQFIFSGYHVLTSSALKSKGVDPLVFALYRELSASVLIGLYAWWAVKKGQHAYVPSHPPTHPRTHATKRCIHVPTHPPTHPPPPIKTAGA